MKIKLVAFGIARDILEGPQRTIETPDNITVAKLLDTLKVQFPAFAELSSLAIALNEEYAELEQIIQPNDEVVLIPPVAGG